jgi:hypothetical protein
MGLFNKTKEKSSESKSDSLLRREFEEIKSIPLPEKTRTIVNVAVESCCGCGCDTTWFHLVGDPGIDIPVSEDTFMNWDSLDSILNENSGIKAYHDRYIKDPQEWSGESRQRYIP